MYDNICNIFEASYHSIFYICVACDSRSKGAPLKELSQTIVLLASFTKISYNLCLFERNVPFFAEKCTHACLFYNIPCLCTLV